MSTKIDRNPRILFSPHTSGELISDPMDTDSRPISQLKRSRDIAFVDDPSSDDPRSLSDDLALPLKTPKREHVSGTDSPSSHSLDEEKLSILAAVASSEKQVIDGERKTVYRSFKDPNAGSVSAAQSTSLPEGSRKSKTLFRCDACGWSTVQLARFLKHKTNSHSKKPEWSIRLSCHSCSFSSPDRGTLEAHERSKHGEHIEIKADPLAEIGSILTGSSNSIANQDDMIISTEEVESGTIRKPLIITLPPSNVPSTSTRGVNGGMEKSMNNFGDLIDIEENKISQRLSGLRAVVATPSSRRTNLEEANARLTTDLASLEKEITRLTFEKQRMIAMSVTVAAFDDSINEGIASIHANLGRLELKLTETSRQRSLGILEISRIDLTLATAQQDILRAEAALSNLGKIRADFFAKKARYESLKTEVDSCYKTILAVFGRKNDLELKRIMDPTLEVDQALELLSLRRDCELDIHGKVRDFITTRTTWANASKGLLAFMEAAKGRVQFN